jgi:asparagine synthase (glutamine-hydrolysing)
MCGIAGFVGRLQPVEEMESIVRAMSASLAHRGPDGSGIWTDRDCGVALAHRRLAIIDLSAEGRQPMVSPSGRFVITFNGEIYNFRDIRKSLERRGVRFRGHSDTEVFLALIEEEGLASALEQSAGMFAFALWDRRDRNLSLVRDRLGEKPLYWSAEGDRVLFGSELRSLVAGFGRVPDLDRDSIALLMRYNYVPAPRSIYGNIGKLEAGTILKVSCRDGVASIRGTHRYWDVSQQIARAKQRRFSGTLDDAASELDLLLRRTVGEQMISDVPIGALLSGGIDSSSIVALMQALSPRPVETFSIGFAEPEFDEAQHARRVAEHLGTSHTEMYVTAEDAMSVIPDLPCVYDEPFSDSSQIPTLLVSRLVRSRVTVALSGDGGDEVFGGYNRYVHAIDLWRAVRWVPSPLRRTAAALIRRIMAQQPGDQSSVHRKNPVPGKPRHPALRDRMQKVVDLLDADGAASVYERLLSHWRQPEQIVIGCSDEGKAGIVDLQRVGTSAEYLEFMMLSDTRNYLPDDILVKVDRAAMSVSLETRIPMLDHRILEFAASLPMEFRCHGRVGKRVLRRLLGRYVPPALTERPKAGFAVPLSSWLRGPLRDWAETMLEPSRMRADGIFRCEPIRALWQEHLTGRRSWAYHLWDILMFQAWLCSEVSGARRKEASTARCETSA